MTPRVRFLLLMLMLCAATLAAVTLIACGSEPRPLRVLDPGPFREADVVATLQAAADVWGGGPNALEDVTVRLQADPADCGPWGPRPGCTTRGEDVAVVVQLWDGGVCPGATALPHEVGHIVLGGDPGHRDPRWADVKFWARVAGAIPGDKECKEQMRQWAECPYCGWVPGG